MMPCTKQRFAYDILVGTGTVALPSEMEWYLATKMFTADTSLGSDLETVLGRLEKDGWQVVEQGRYGTPAPISGNPVVVELLVKCPIEEP